jgi:hypothetical protein
MCGVRGRRAHQGSQPSIYFKDPNGVSLEYCCVVRNLTEDDATMHERFTVGRAALELSSRTAIYQNSSDRPSGSPAACPHTSMSEQYDRSC